MRKLVLLFAWVICVFTANAQQPQLNSAQILQGLQKLNTVGSVLYIAAHPDDENTRLLAYLSNERNLRTGYLSLTRGDGGQNLIGKEQGPMLGLIRTNELLAARRSDGAEQFFSTAYDFGFSKNPEETFKFWDKEKILGEVVYVIRKFKPDVIICRFPTTGEGGHGHHTASAILAQEAFEAAADPSKFPEQLHTVQTWQAKRLFWNTFNFGGNNTTSPNQVKVDVGGYNPLLGKSYGEIAAESRSMHKSQGFGSARSRGSQIEYFKQLKGDSVKNDLFEGIDVSWNRVQGGDKIQKQINKCIKNYNALDPSASVPALVDIYRQLQQLPSNNKLAQHWKAIKLEEAKNLIVNCAGLWAEAYAADYRAVPGHSFDMSIQVINRSASSIKLDKITWPEATDTTTSLSLKKNEPFNLKHSGKVSESAPYSNPYWLKGAAADTPFSVTFHFNIAGTPIQVERPVVYKFTDPVKGEIYRPLEILPAVTIDLSERVYVFTDNMPKKIQFVIRANTDNVKGTFKASVPQGWKLSLNTSSAELVMKNKGDETVVEGTVIPSDNSSSGKLAASVTVDGQLLTWDIERIEFDHIPYQFNLVPAEASLVRVDMKTAVKNIGYIPGAGDAVAECLKQAGYNVTILSDEQLAGEDLSKYEAIVTGVRAYNTNERLQVHYSRLMEYVEKGGNLIVQYNTNNRIGPLVAKIAPYPFSITRNRVTDENAEVNFIDPGHPVLNYPNNITSGDFKGWIQERGIYFADELDKNYQTILSMNDPGEKPLEGSLIIAKYGKGYFAYTGLAFFRELPAGVPGTYRLFANLLSLGKE